jgi:hypothetical protein
MIVGKVKGIMTNCLIRLASNEKKHETSVSIGIRTTEEDFTPSYFYTVNGQPVMNEEKTEFKELDFNRDILGVKFDLLGQKYLTANYIKNLIKSVVEVEKIPSKELFYLIRFIDSDSKVLTVGMYQKGKFLRSMSINDFLGDN